MVNPNPTGGWKKGQSGNPSGRPKEVREVLKLARERSTEAIERLTFWMRSNNAKASVSACNAILDRALGKPSQPIVGGDEDDNPVKIAGKLDAFTSRIARIVARAEEDARDREAD